jgi:hypothetical protein
MLSLLSSLAATEGDEKKSPMSSVASNVHSSPKQHDDGNEETSDVKQKQNSVHDDQPVRKQIYNSSTKHTRKLTRALGTSVSQLDMSIKSDSDHQTKLWVAILQKKMNQLLL